MINNRTNAEILEELDEYVSGHLEAKKALITLLSRSAIRHYQKYGLLMHKDYLLKPSKLLLIGASGTGKTHLLESLHSLIDFPLVRIDATQLNPAGASGGLKKEDLERMITRQADIYSKTRKEYASAQGAIDRTVVFVDEIDKLARSFDSSGNWNNHVQSNFLTLFDNKEQFSAVSFIFAGAFTDITKTKELKMTSGFNNDLIENKIDLDAEIIKIGLLPELVGRLTSIVELDRFTSQDYYNILNERLLPKKQMDLAAMKILDVRLSEERKWQMAKKAVKSEMGIRALQRELDKEFADLEFRFEEFGNMLRLDILEEIYDV